MVMGLEAEREPEAYVSAALRRMEVDWECIEYKRTLDRQRWSASHLLKRMIGVHDVIHFVMSPGCMVMSLETGVLNRSWSEVCTSDLNLNNLSRSRLSCLS